jgi:TolB-like protein/DNA-binding winged helix-turn-helix (wHTH) protein/lipoprotein NlpI
LPLRGGIVRVVNSRTHRLSLERHLASGPVTFGGRVRFGEDFELDFASYKLRRSGHLLKLERIPIELLILLVQQRGEIVARDQIVEKIWGKNVFLDSDNSINGAVRKIRQVLNDDPEQPRFIQTITGQGYRFIASIHEERTKLAADASRQTPPTAESSNGQNHATPLIASRPQLRRVAKPSLLLGLVAVLAMVAFGIWLGWFRHAQSVTSKGRPMLAVLPFQNLTGDASQDYFSDGLTEEMLTRLGDLDPGHLGVIARTSIMRYKNTQPSLQIVARELGVDYVLEGSVRRDSDKVRITAQLIQTRDQTHIWAREYDRELTSLLAVQSEIAQEVADEIQLTLNHKDRGGPRPLLSPEALKAYDFYLKGRYFWNKRTSPGFELAVNYFQQSIAKQSTNARAYAGLADTYALMSSYGYAPVSDVIPKARMAALKALQLDDSLAEVHASLALIAENYDWDWETAEKEFRRAIELDPNYATAHQWYAEFLAFEGRFDEALAESERARELDPLSLIIAADNGAILYFARQYDRAIEQFRAVLDVEPDSARAHLILLAYAQKGQFAAALHGIEEWRRVDNGPWTWAVEAYVYGRAGQQAQARQVLQRLEQVNRQWHLDPAPMYATAYSGMGQKDEALASLEKAYAEHSNALNALKVDPIYDPLRNDPRFQILLRRVGFSN